METRTDILVPHVGWMAYPKNDEVARFISEGWYENAEQAFWWLYLRDGDVVIDGGAHCGLYSRLAAQVVGQGGRVIAVEPVEELVDLIGINTEQFTGVEIVGCALGEDEGEARFSVEDSGRLAYTTALSDESAPGFDTKIITLDGLISERAIDRVAILKLDVEGSEPEALAGVSGAIKSGKIDIVMMEFDEKNLQRCSSSTQELAGMLIDAGLGLFRFDAEKNRIEPLEISGPLWYDNVLAVRDPEEVQARLDSSDQSRLQIAKDLALRSKWAGSLVQKAWGSEQNASTLREQEESNTRLNDLLQEANADRSDLRDAIAEVEARVNEANSDRDSLRKAVSHSLQDIIKVEADRKNEQEARASAELRLSNAEQKSEQLRETISTVATTLGDGQELGADQDIGEALIESSRDMAHELQSTRLLNGSLRQQLDLSNTNLSAAASLASQYGGVLERLIRIPMGRGVIATLVPDKAPWLSDLRADLGRVRRLWPEAMRIDLGAENGADQCVSDAPCISVILCTHNPRMDLLKWTLDSIKAQTLDSSRFELVIVDNNSTPAIDAGELDPGGVLGLRVVQESRAGLSFARIAGMRATTSPLILFVDDDNALAPDYLAQSISIAQADPAIGCFGGVSEAVLETDPPIWILDLLPHLGVRNHGDEPNTSKATHWGEWDPIGAGMVVRRPIVERFASTIEDHDLNKVLGRRGKVLSSGEDTLMNRCANYEGYACSYQPSLCLKHFMKADRFNRKYLCKILEGHGQAFVALERIVGREVNAVPYFKRQLWLVQRAVFRLSKSLYSRKKFGLIGALKHGFVHWRWDIGYMRAASDQSSCPSETPLSNPDSENGEA